MKWAGFVEMAKRSTRDEQAPATGTRCWLLVALAAGVGCFACSEVDEDRPPLAPPCSECPPPGGVSGGTGGGTGAAGAPNGETTTLSGTVGRLSGVSFQRIVDFPQLAVVYGPGRRAFSVSAPYDGASFTLSGVQRDSSIVLAVRPESTATVFDTFSEADTTQTRVTLPVVERSLLEDIFLSLSTPTQVAPRAAQVVLRVVGPNGEPLAGASVVGATAELVAYSVGGTFSDTETLADGEGLIVLGNVPAPAFPGSELVLRVRRGATTFDETVRVARGFVTLARAVVLP